MSRLLCKIFGHRRNIHGIRRSGSTWRSTCVHCHQPLIRVSRGAWKLRGLAEGAAEDLIPLPLFDHKAINQQVSDG